MNGIKRDDDFTVLPFIFFVIKKIRRVNAPDPDKFARAIHNESAVVSSLRSALGLPAYLLGSYGSLQVTPEWS